MSENKKQVKLDDYLIHLHQSINIDYLAVVSSSGKVWADAGSTSPISQEDVSGLLNSYFRQVDNICPVGEFDQIRFIKKGAAECFIAPLDGKAQIIAVASIERPSVSVRKLVSELNLVRKDISAMITEDQHLAEESGDYQSDNGEYQDQVNTNMEDSSDDAFEKIIDGSVSEPKTKEASKFWDGARLEEAEYSQDGKSISYDEAKRSGLVPPNQP